MSSKPVGRRPQAGDEVPVTKRHPDRHGKTTAAAQQGLGGLKTKSAQELGTRVVEVQQKRLADSPSAGKWAAIGFVLLLLGGTSGTLAYLAQHGVKELQSLKKWSELMAGGCLLFFLGSTAAAVHWKSLKGQREALEGLVGKVQNEVEQDRQTIMSLSADLKDLGIKGLDAALEIQGVVPKIRALKERDQKFAVPPDRRGAFLVLFRTLERRAAQLGQGLHFLDQLEDQESQDVVDLKRALDIEQNGPPSSAKTASP